MPYDREHGDPRVFPTAGLGPEQHTPFWLVLAVVRKLHPYPRTPAFRRRVEPA